MSQYILFHGTTDKDEYYSDKYPSLSNMHWFPWLQKQLLIQGHQAHTPEVFEAFAPTYEKWLRELNRYEINEETVLVGHSCGGGFLLRWLTENEVRVKKVILVAPWLDPAHQNSGSMFDFGFDDSISEKAEVVVFYSTNDYEDVQKSVEMIKENLPELDYREFKNYGHFLINEIGEKFPELREECLR